MLFFVVSLFRNGDGSVLTAPIDNTANQLPHFTSTLITPRYYCRLYFVIFFSAPSLALNKKTSLKRARFDLFRLKPDAARRQHLRICFRSRFAKTTAENVA
ncbi:MAG: hypothetical protein ACI9G1_003421 [Pirellulaceae bacterium]|jgi:hypothetical protein